MPFGTYVQWAAGTVEEWAIGTVEWAAETEDSVQLMARTVEEAAGTAVGDGLGA